MAGTEDDTLTHLRTKRLRLRRFVEGDWRHLFELDSDPEVMRYLSGGRPTPEARIREEVIPRVLASYTDDGHQGYWVVEDGQGFMGWVHFRPDRLEDGAVEVGYRLARRAWGMGYATEVSRALISHGALHRGVSRITARALTGNAASRRVMEKCGLVYEADYICPPEILPDLDDDERAAVLYGQVFTAADAETLAPWLPSSCPDSCLTDRQSA